MGLTELINLKKSTAKTLLFRETNEKNHLYKIKDLTKEILELR